MALFRTSTLLCLGIVAGIAFAAQAQMPGPSVATLSSTDQVPRASSHLSIPSTGAVVMTPSRAYVGPAPGAGTGSIPPRFERSAHWNKNPMNGPYEAGLSPRPN